MSQHTTPLRLRPPVPDRTRRPIHLGKNPNHPRPAIGPVPMGLPRNPFVARARSRLPKWSPKATFSQAVPASLVQLIQSCIRHIYHLRRTHAHASRADPSLTPFPPLTHSLANPQRQQVAHYGQRCHRARTTCPKTRPPLESRTLRQGETPQARNLSCVSSPFATQRHHSLDPGHNRTHLRNANNNRTSHPCWVFSTSA